MRTLLHALCAAAFLASCISLPTRSPVYDSRVLHSGITVRDLVLPDEGRAAKMGERIRLHYELFLGDGTLLDSSLERGLPFELTLGDGTLGHGFEEGLVGLRLHGRREIVVPPEEAFGDGGLPPRIPPRAILRMVAELVSIQAQPED